MTMRCTSEVPSPISQSLASRNIRSTGYSREYPLPPMIWIAEWITRIAASDEYSLAIDAG